MQMNDLYPHPLSAVQAGVEPDLNCYNQVIKACLGASTVMVYKKVPGIYQPLTMVQLVVLRVIHVQYCLLEPFPGYECS